MAGRFLAAILSAGAWFAGTLAASAQNSNLVLTEFMAANAATLADEDGDYPDWIEIHNAGAEPANLFNWCLTDSAANFTKWRFPSTNLAANGYLVVFASEKDRRIPGAPLHTNFKLSTGGEFLALVAPDGTNTVSSFAPVYPPQSIDVSYGLGRVIQQTTLLETGAVGRVLVPLDGVLGASWVQPEFNDGAWSNALTGIGFQVVNSTNNFRPSIKTDLQQRMWRTNATAYLRLPFVVADPADVDHLSLQLKYDDGYIAFLNGVEVSADRAPDEPAWNSAATEDRPDPAALSFVSVSLDSSRGLLRAGTNVLALQGLNSSNANVNFLLLPRLVAGQDATPVDLLRYFSQPTPGAPNGVGVADLGPIVSEAQHTPPVPRDEEDLVVTCRLTATFAPVASATLHYRVMYSNEVAAPLLDDGHHEDGAAGDGVYGARIPSAASNPGQMVRWYVTATDTSGRVSRWPAYEDPLDSPQYEGTIIGNEVATRLPVLHWFVENPALAATDPGTRCSVFYLGEFYDNVFTGIRGQASRGYPKKSYKLDFNKGHHFRFDPARDRVEEMNLMTTSSDKSFLRITMAYESFRDAGCPWMISFPVRVQQNAAFYSVSILSEHPDETWLKRNGLDPNGAFYKMFNALDTVSGADKRTRLFEDTRDMAELVASISTSNTNRVRWLYDNVDLAAMVNYLAVMIIIHDNDAPHKNYWMYRDSDGTREWRMLPWDKDLSFGMNFNGGLSDVLWATNDGSGIVSPSHPFFADQRHQKVDLQWNRLVEAMYITPPILEMFKRRLRSVMDLLLQSPGTWPTQRRYEQRMDYFYDLMKDDVALDRTRWPYAFGAQMDFLTGLNALKEGYLAPRRLHLYLTHSVHNPGYSKSALLPDAQPDDAVLLLGAVDFNPASGRQDEEYVQVVNTNAFAADLSGWRVTGGIQHAFEPGTVVPSNSVLYLSPNAAAFRSRADGPRGGQTNFVQGNYRGRLSARGDTLQLVDAHERLVHTLTYAGNPSPAQLYLRVTELMYHPAPPPAGSAFTADDFEYIELKNLGPATLDLAGLRFTAGVGFNFTSGAVTQLGSGQRLLLVKNLAAFTSRYGAIPVPIAGEFLGNLDNNGETLRLEDAVGEVVFEFTYDNRWLPLTDGFGFSLVAAREDADWREWSRPEQWRPSETAQGGPGAEDDLPADLPPVRITEVFSASAFPLRDAVEIFNPGPASADLSGWWLTDDLARPKKYQLPPGSLVEPGGYLVLDETQFNAPGLPQRFSFSSSGDEAYLFAADAAGNLLGYLDGFHFGAAESGVSFGRHVTSLGETRVVAQASRTLGAPNAGPKIGPVILSEISYHPPDLAEGVDNADDEFVEVRNLTMVEQLLFDPDAPTNTWRIRGGIDFDFPGGLSLPPGATVLVVSFDPGANAAALLAFRQRLAPPAETLLLGPFRGKLQNSSDRVALEKPNPPVAGVTAYVSVDEVTYADQSSWPSEADGLGLSLQRRQPVAYADDPASWFGAAPTPGTFATPGGAAPSLVLLPAAQTVLATRDASFQVMAQGQPTLRYQWRREGIPLPGATAATLLLTNVQPQQAGDYDVVVFNEAGSTISPPAALVVQTPPVIAVQPAGQVVLVGSSYSLVVHAFGTGPVRYQWRIDDAPIAGETNNVLAFANLQEAQTGDYSVLVTDAVGSVPSQTARVAVVRAPALTSALPAQMTVVAGDTVQLGINADGTLPLSYRWRRNGIVFTNYLLFAHSSLLVLSNVQAAQAGIYSVNITNLAPASAQSGGCTLTVQADLDGDHIADVWEIANGFSTNNAADAFLDSDGDGVNNYEEFRAGTDPKDPLSYLKVELAELRPGAAVLQFGAGSNRTYSVQFSDQTGGLWLGLTNVFSRSTNWKASVTDPAAPASRRFYRLLTPYQP